MTAGTRVLRNSLANIFGNLFIRVLTLTFWAFIARRLCVGDFGIFAFAFATIGIIASLSDFGISYLVMREVSRETRRVQEYFATGVLLKLLFALVAFIVLALTLVLLGNLGIKARLLMILGLTLPITAINLAIFSIFNAFEKMHISALLEALSTFIYLVFGSALLLNGGGLLQLGWAYVTSSMAALAISVWLFRKEVGFPKFRFDSALSKVMLKKTVGFALSSVFVEIYFRIGVVIVATMVGDASTGIFSAAYRLITALVFIPSALMQALFPNLSRLYPKSQEALRHWMSIALKWLAVLALSLALVTTLLADRILDFIYGGAYVTASTCLRILIWALAVLFVNSVLTFTLYASDKQNFTGSIAIVKTICNVGLGVVLVTIWKEIGMSIAILITELVGFVLHYLYLSHRVVRVNLLQSLLKPAAVALLVGGFVQVFRDLNLVLLIVLSGIVLAFFLLVLRIINESETRSLKSLFNGLLQRIVRRTTPKAVLCLLSLWKESNGKRIPD